MGLVEPVEPAGAAAGPVEDDERRIVDALGRVLASGAFRAAPRSRELLSFVVTETVAGRGHLLNERVIARVALGRPADLDTRVDAGARVQAGRTRDLLARYYSGEGVDDPVRLSIPVGQYAASFSRRSPVGSPAVPDGPARSVSSSPAVAVVQLRHRAAGVDRRLAAGLTESLVETLGGFPGLRVVGPVLPGAADDPADDALTVGARTSADYVLHGGVRSSDGYVRVTAHLTSVASGETTWSETFERDVEGLGGFAVEDDIVAHVAGAVGDVGGVVLRASVRAHTADPVVAEALGRYYAFLDDLDPLAGIEAAVALQEAHARVPDDSHVLSSLAFAHAVDVLMRGAAATDSMATATDLARRCLALDPSSATAHNVLGVVALARGHLATAATHAGSALALTPHHPANAYVAGMVIGASTDWQRGIGLIREVVRVNPYGPNHRRTLLAVDALLRDDVPGALAEASLLHFPGYLYGPLLRAVALSELGMADEARAEMDAVLAIVPDFLDHPGEVLGAAPTMPDHAVEHLVARLPR